MVTEAGSSVADLLVQAQDAFAARRYDAATDLLASATRLARTAEDFRGIESLQRRFGRLDLAAAALREVLRLQPGDPGAFLLLAEMGHRTLTDAEISALTTAFESASPANRAALAFALGKTHQDHGDIERSFSYYEIGNRAVRATLSFDLDSVASTFAEIKSTFSRALFQRFAGAGVGFVEPIFIVGMPRSGSTLTEHILATHPAVLGSGEMNLMPRVEATMLDEAGTTSLSALFAKAQPSEMVKWARAYYDPVRRALNGKSRFTDKNLDNFRRIGLIKLLFPQARIVHCTRDPLDQALSIYRRVFDRNNLPYSYDLAELGRYYALYLDLMRHWQEVLPGFVFDHRYEDLVADPERSTRRLFSHCHLDWSPAVLKFHETNRGVATASQAQVRRPLYADSIGAGVPYRDHLAPFLEAVRAFSPTT